MTALAGLKVALLIANGFNETEFSEIQRALLKAGAHIKTISTEKTLANGWLDNGWGHYFPVDQHISDALASDFDALVLTGGERSVAKLMGNPHSKRIIGHFFDAMKPLAAFNEAVTLLTLTGKLEGRTVTADKADPQMAAAGARVTDDVTTMDGNLLTIQSHEARLLIEALTQHLEGVEELAAA